MSTTVIHLIKLSELTGFYGITPEFMVTAIMPDMMSTMIGILTDLITIYDQKEG
jgi:hypothetical protein